MQAEDEYIPFPEFVEQLGLSYERREPEQPAAPPTRQQRDTRTREQIMAAAQQVADLDSRRIQKHIDAGRWDLVPAHLRPK